MTTITAMFRIASGWAEPPSPPTGIPGVRRGQVLRPEHQAWSRWHDPAVWGTMAGFGAHNPFMGDHDPEADPLWRQSRTHRHLSALATYNPEAYQKAHQGMVHGLRGARTAIALSTPVLHKVLDSGRIKSGFETNHNFKGDLSDGDYLLGRRRQEQLHFGYPHDHPAEARPVYGYLTHDLFADRSARAYGEHTLVLSPSVSHRTTWSAADSMDERDELRPSARNAPNLRSIPKWMTDPERSDMGLRRFLSDHEERGGDYMEAQVHGGLPLHQVHYAILRTPDTWRPEAAEHEDLARRLSEHGVPWIHVTGSHTSDPALARAWDDAGRRRRTSVHASITTGALASSYDHVVRWHQGESRFLVELDDRNPAGHRMGQIADLEWGLLYQPTSVDSILGRGYWERLPYPVDAEDVLPLTRPVGA